METPSVPEELIQQLHQANERFANEKLAFESSVDGNQYRHQERVNIAAEKLRQAEREVEEIEGRIREFLKHTS